MKIIKWKQTTEGHRVSCNAKMHTINRTDGQVRYKNCYCKKVKDKGSWIKI